MRYLELWHLLSLDAPTVAVVWTLAFAWVARVMLPIWVPLLLALGAWCVYIGDRLMDARAANTPLRTRHHFHWKNRRLLLPMAIGAATLASLLILFAIRQHQMPVAARERNAILAVAALAYLGSVHLPLSRFSLPHQPGRKVRRRFFKEFLVALLFTLACAAPSLSRTPRLTAGSLLPAAGCFLVAWLNCVAIESWENESSSQPALPISLLAAWLAIPLLAAATFLGRASQGRPAVLLLSMAISAALLAWLHFRRSRLAATTLRALADLVLLTPAAVLLLR